MAEFETPSFLQNRSTDEIYEKIKSILPKDIDLSAGGHGWNMTRPIALIGAEICEFVLPEVVKLILPEWSYGEFLVGHAKGRGIYPREATAATGEITITGKVESTIPAGSLFSVPSVNGEPSIDYATIADAVIPKIEEGDTNSVTVGVVCTQKGTIGNTGPNTIVLASSKLTGITSVTNENAIEGGQERESDAELLEKIEEYDKTQGYSFVGNESDYKRWAQEAGAGSVSVISAEDESGLVTLIITDPDGNLPDDILKDKVYDHIMSPNDREARLAPVGAILSVVAPSTCAISIKATIELEPAATIESVKAKFAPQIALYLAEALDEGEIKYSQIWAVLAGISGVADFKDLQIGEISNGVATYGTSNIPLTDRQLPTVSADNLILTEGTV